MLEKRTRDRVTEVALEPLSETVVKLKEVRRVLDGVEATALSGVAVVLIEAAEGLSQTAKHLSDTRPTDWMTAERAAAYLGFKSVQAFEKVVLREGVPRHYVSERRPLYNRIELDEWLMNR